MQTLPLEEYRKQIKLEHARLDALEEVARLMLKDGKPLPEVAKYTQLPVRDLQNLVTH